jgi:endonuclease-8
VPVAELLTATDLARHEALQALGPDLADPAFDSAEVLRRIRAHDSDTIQDVLLNQRVVSGIGNVFKSEVLFVAAVDPFARTGQLTDDVLMRTIDVARKQMAMNVIARADSVLPGVGRRTTGSLDPAAKLWVYGRGGKPCRRCGTAIASKVTGVDGRLTYWCPQCQKGA